MRTLLAATMVVCLSLPSCGDDGRDEPLACSDQQPLFAACASNEQCQSGVCRNGYCTESCSSETPCDYKKFNATCEPYDSVDGCTYYCDDVYPCPNSPDFEFKCQLDASGFNLCLPTSSCNGDDDTR